MTFSSAQDGSAAELQVVPRPPGYLAVMMVALATVFILGGGWKLLTGLTVLVLAIVVFAAVLLAMFKGNADRILVGWVFLYPLGYYLLSYPRERPVIQFDRLLIACLLVAVLMAPRNRIQKIPAGLKRSGIAWGFFLAATCISFLMAENVLTVGRLIVDGLLLPAILGWYIVRQFRMHKHKKWLHTAVCTISIYCAAMGLTEVIRQHDLMHFVANENYVLQDSSDPTAFVFLRPNGPFLSDSTYAVAGLISLFLLAFLWSQIRDSAGVLRRGFHWIGMLAALLQATLPVFRSIFLTLVIAVILCAFWAKGRRRILWLSVLGAFPVIILVVKLMIPSVAADRASSDNIIGRFSQDQQSWRLFIDHPVIGVGLFNMQQVVATNPRYEAELANNPPLDFPHNNLAWIAIETGTAGLIPFVLSQIFLVVAFRQLASRGERGQAVWRYFILIFLAYWTTGFTETAAYYGELNMWFIFAVALLYCYGMEEMLEGGQKACMAAEGAAA